jgi:hypothetical protein
MFGFADFQQEYVDDHRLLIKPCAFLPRALARGLESKNTFGVLTPETCGLKPERIAVSFWLPPPEGGWSGIGALNRQH